MVAKSDDNMIGQKPGGKWVEDGDGDRGNGGNSLMLITESWCSGNNAYSNSESLTLSGTTVSKTAVLSACNLVEVLAGVCSLNNLLGAFF